MKAPATVPLADELAQRRLEHGTVHYLQVNEDDLRELAEGRVPEIIQRNAGWAMETVEQTIARKRRKA